MPDQAQPKKSLLTIELVPLTCWFSNVRSEVSPAQWDSLRKTTAHHAGNRCQICGGRGPQWPVECHELWHYDDEQHIQTLLGLTALCPACHEVKHMGLANVRGRDHLAARHLAKVNGWTAAEANTYISEQFAVWKRRSAFQWQLDLSWLEECGIQIRDKTRGGANRV